MPVAEFVRIQTFWANPLNSCEFSYHAGVAEIGFRGAVDRRLVDAWQCSAEVSTLSCTVAPVARFLLPTWT
jgi:hypothetical protein